MVCDFDEIPQIFLPEIFDCLTREREHVRMSNN